MHFLPNKNLNEAMDDTMKKFGTVMVDIACEIEGTEFVTHMTLSVIIDRMNKGFEISSDCWKDGKKAKLIIRPTKGIF